jgi:transcriptional regulator with XRE-family HTH domain
VERVYRGRVEFGARLRRLREEADLTGAELARRAGWAQSKVSRIETGAQNVRADDVRLWADVVGAAPELVDDLLADLRSLRVEHASWRRQLRNGHAPKQHALLALEASTTLDRTFQPDLVPGLLQTPDYARHVFHSFAELHGAPQDIETSVRLRMRRQAVLYDESKRFRFLVTEAALTNGIAPARVQREQLDRLAILTSLSNVEVAVIPMGSALPIVPQHGFSISDSALVLVETFSAELQLRDTEDIALYERIFTLLWDASVPGGRFIEGLIRGHRA